MKKVKINECMGEITLEPCFIKLNMKLSTEYGEFLRTIDWNYFSTLSFKWDVKQKQCEKVIQFGIGFGADYSFSKVVNRKEVVNNYGISVFNFITFTNYVSVSFLFD